MALILGVPTVELELQGTMQVPSRGKKGGELHPYLTANGLTKRPCGHPFLASWMRCRQGDGNARCTL